MTDTTDHNLMEACDGDASLEEYFRDDKPINARQHGIQAILDSTKRHTCFTLTWGGRTRLLVDATTAKMVATIYNQVNDANKARIRDRIAKSQESFLLLVTKLWKLVK